MKVEREMLAYFLSGLLVLSMSYADVTHVQSTMVGEVLRRYSFGDDGFEEIVPISGIPDTLDHFSASLRIRGKARPSNVRCKAQNGEWFDVQEWPLLIIWGRIHGWTFSTSVAAEDSVFTTILEVVDTRKKSRYGPTALFSPERDNVLKVYIVDRQNVFHPSCEWVRSDPYYELHEFAVVIESLDED